MNDLTSQPWFGWAIGLAVGVPAVLVVLTELHGLLIRRNHPLAGTVATLRNFAVPAAAVWLLLTKAWDISREGTWVRIIATFVGFLVIVLALSAINVVLFSTAADGSWRKRLPSIFIDIARLVLIIAGLAFLFSWVWGANVGGLFAALGVTSIVLGFALQNAVGSIISGLLLLFEQPFKLGDWLNTGATKGRVVQVNWRAVHLDTGGGIQIIPNASLAGAAFTNLSEPPGPHLVTLPTTFAAGDRPELVRRLLDQIANDLPVVRPGTRPRTEMTGPKSYATTIAVDTPAEADDVAATFYRWTWYAARRSGLRLDGVETVPVTGAEREAAVASIAHAFHLNTDDTSAVAEATRLEMWAAGETILRVDTVPEGIRFVLHGSVDLETPTNRGRVLITQLNPGDYFGQATLTRRPVITDGIAGTETQTLLLPQALIDELVRTRTALADELGKAIDLRRIQVTEALTAADATFQNLTRR